MGDTPTGTVTFLFTDIEGSTRLWEERPDEMRAALAEHDALVRAAIDTHEGYVFATGGDGFAAAFPRAHDAIDAARKAQAALADHPLIKVRMGIHIGEVQERDGDYFGPAVNRAARIMAVAHGRQIVLSAATAALLTDRPDLLDLGVHRLRDFEREERIYQCGPGEFGPLRASSDTARGNVPTPRSTFIGRDPDIGALCELVDRWRVVTITGPGGVGKTRVALQTGHELVRRFPDGVWWVELGAVSAADQVEGAITATLRVQRREGLSFTDSLADHLRRQQILLVLDNCEHVLDAAARVADVVTRSCERVTILSTSREPLGLDGEHVYPLGPLDVPTVRDVAAVESASATALFVDRARAADPTFTVDHGNAPAIARLCERLDALPLAIELAAAKSAAFTPAQLEQLLDQRFRLLTRTGPDVPRRQQTLEATIAWSYELLTEDEATLLDRLSVFAGSFGLEAAQMVAGDEPLDDFAVASHLAALVRKSLVVTRFRHGERQYALLETVRAFAEQHLRQSGVLETYRDRHLDHFVGVAERVGSGFVTKDERLWTERVRRDLDELRHAFRWAVDRDRADAAFAITASLGRCGWMYPSLDIHSWHLEALAMPVSDNDRNVALTTQWAAGTLGNVGDFDLADELARRAIEAERSSGVPTPFAWIIVAGRAANVGTTDDAVNATRALVASAMRESPIDPTVIGIAANILGAVEAYDEAAAQAEHALELAAERPTPSNLFWAHLASSSVLMTSDPEAAIGAADNALAATTADFPQLTWALLPRISSLILLGRMGEARADLDRALPLAVRGGLGWAAILLTGLTVPVLRHLGEQRRAAAIYRAVHSQFRAQTWATIITPPDTTDDDLPSFSNHDELVAFALESLRVAGERMEA